MLQSNSISQAFEVVFAINVLFSFYSNGTKIFLNYYICIADMLNWKRDLLQFFCHLTSEVKSSQIVFNP